MVSGIVKSIRKEMSYKSERTNFIKLILKLICTLELVYITLITFGYIIGIVYCPFKDLVIIGIFCKIAPLIWLSISVADIFIFKKLVKNNQTSVCHYLVFTIFLGFQTVLISMAHVAH